MDRYESSHAFGESTGNSYSVYLRSWHDSKSFPHTIVHKLHMHTVTSTLSSHSE